MPVGDLISCGYSPTSARPDPRCRGAVVVTVPWLRGDCPRGVQREGTPAVSTRQGGGTSVCPKN